MVKKRRKTRAMPVDVGGDIYLDFGGTNSQPNQNGFQGVVKKSLKGLKGLGNQVVQSYKYRQTPEFKEAQLKNLQLKNKLLKEQEEMAKRKAAIQKSRMQGRGNGFGSGWGNMLPGPYGNQNMKKRR